MPPSPLDSLAVVPLSALVLHEAVEPRRAAAVRDGIRRSGVLNDPIVAAPAPDGRWLVLDGAHRTTALAALGIPAAVIQQMPIRLAGAPAADGEAGAGARVDAWAHDISGIDPVRLRPAVVRAVDRGREHAVVAVVEGGGQRMEITAPADLTARLRVMWDVAGRYAGLPYVRRHPGAPGPAAGTVRVSWAPARPTDLAELAVAGSTFPAGVSRFIVRGRVLGVRVPLAELARAAPDGLVIAAVADELVERLGRLSVRLYSEPVWVVESADPHGASEGPNLGPR